MSIGETILAKIGTDLLNFTVANDYTITLDANNIVEGAETLESFNSESLACYGLDQEGLTEINSSGNIIKSELLAYIDLFAKATSSVPVSRLTEKLIEDLKGFVYGYASKGANKLNLKSVGNKTFTVTDWGVNGQIFRNIDYGQKKIWVGITINIFFNQFPERL